MIKKKKKTLMSSRKFGDQKWTFTEQAYVDNYNIFISLQRNINKSG